ncbi:MAG: glutamate--tRNA ligase [Neomegalonema sp.]|nr:glutamate--tRNA ligase [Neomegalonema sp.]
MTTTRFAPSPTGKLHIGNLRAALLSYLTAKKAGGSFILRIDDTDPERSKEEYVDAAKRDLEWLGLHWDRFERQSLRLERYEAAAAKWKEMGLLYACYETPTELELRRKRQASMGKPPVYDRAALKLTAKQKAEYEAEGRRPHWRFKLDQVRVGWEDQIRGETSVDLASVSDPVLIRADGSWLYTPCSVVDDGEMGITHVVRGEDHVTNTATQIQMIQSLGFEVPTFGHHSLLVGPQGEALSKRLGSLTLEGLREEGLEALSLVAFMARLGTSDPIEPRASLAQVVENFDITRFGRSPARFDIEELRGFNAKILHALPLVAVEDSLRALGLEGEEAEAFWAAVAGNLTSRADIALWAGIVREGAEPDIAPEDAEFVAQAMALAPARPWDEKTWSAWADAAKKASGRKGKGLFMPLRKALTGQSHGPDMGALLPLLKNVKALDLAK